MDYNICYICYYLLCVAFIFFLPFLVLIEHFILFFSPYNVNYTLLNFNCCPRAWYIHLQWIQIHCQITLYFFTANENTFIVMKYSLFVSLLFHLDKSPYAGTHTYKHIIEYIVAICTNLYVGLRKRKIKNYFLNLIPSLMYSFSLYLVFWPI